MMRVEADRLLDTEHPPVARLELLDEFAMMVAEEMDVCVTIEIKARPTCAVYTTITPEVRAKIFRAALKAAVEVPADPSDRIDRYRKALAEAEALVAKHGKDPGED